MVNSHTDIQQANRTRNRYCAFYTESDPILDLMISRLNINDGDQILEPSAGEGVFIDKLLDRYHNLNIKIDALDIDENATNRLKIKYSDEKKVNVRNTDTLLDLELDLYANAGGHYHKVIGNPPYGAWLDHEQRTVLKKKYGNYARETYTLFLQRVVETLLPSGRVVFIIPDTFLALNLHKQFRSQLLMNTVIEEIVLFPSKFFPGVNFGYSNLCIITLTKCNPHLIHKLK